MTTKYTPDRPFESQACLAFVGLSVVTATLGFWHKGWLPGMLLTVAMIVIVFLLSRAVERVMEAWETRNYATAIIAAVLGVGFCCIEAGLNHIGMEHLNAQHQFAPDWALWPACFFISLVNVFASFGFARAMKDHRQVAPVINPARLLAEKRWNKAA